MRTASLVMAATSILIASAPEAAPQANCTLSACEGRQQTHHKDYYTFNTASRVYNDEEYYVFETCVENTGDRDLQFRWQIPGPDSWVPSGCAVISPRDRTSDERLEPYSGCARYGNSWQSMRAEFIPPVSDRKAIEAEMGTDCPIDKATETGTRPEGTVGAVSSELELFAPSVSYDAEHTLTMVSITAHIEVNYDRGVFIQHVHYRTGPAYIEQNEYVYKGLFIAPPFDARFSYDGTVSVDGRDVLVLNESGSFTAEFKMPSRPALTSTRYEIISEDGQVVAAAYLPMWVEASGEG